jgi:hypothetical protein
MYGKFFLCMAALMTALSMPVEAQESAGNTRRSYAVTNFHSVASVGAHEVIVTIGAAPSVRAEGPAEILDRMEVVVEGNELDIRFRRDLVGDFNWSGRRKAVFYVTVPALRAAELTGSGSITVDRIEGERFSGRVTGSGSLAVRSLQVSDASFSMMGSGALSARGRAERAPVVLTGSGRASLGEVMSRDADVSLMGSGKVDLGASQRAQVSLMGPGNVVVTGGARCSVSNMGGGNVRCG